MISSRIERILNSGCRAVFVTTGGGSSAFHALLTTPGASRFVSEALVPYSAEALNLFLGETPVQSVSSETAFLLARRAFSRYAASSNLLAVSCTAALSTDRERRGDDRAWICIKKAAGESLYVIHFSHRSRTEQEKLLGEWILRLIAHATSTERGLMLPGSFNPVHQGHLNLLTVSEEITGLRGVFELSAVNVDKPVLEEAEWLRRAKAIRDIPVAFTRSPRFIQKVQHYPNTTFVLGYDTVERLLRYAEPGELDLFQCADVRFLVAGRFVKGGNADSSCFQTLDQLVIPKGFETLFEAIPESKFREDISSTDLRG
ncbi:MAG: hypothetical protein FJ220_01995 [Kiritimatiellaceae bacterium]|nr:hypothetical protein [Kiritimatiellaceae bacterium]